MDIEKTVNEVAAKYNTRDPFTIADKTGIYVSFEDLGTLHGYYLSVFGVKSIHINKNLSKENQIITCAHELGHSVLHPDLDASFMTKNTFMVLEKYEKQANLFASFLLFPTSRFSEYPGLSAEEIAFSVNLPAELLKIRA
ncbi:MAG: ImmA/IrrE family metallo-endopeptidase [Clostridia bacterium]|nr:ImmA/IrrE family metallo-endopeptidase [Clostridia bacterium]